MLTRFWFAFDRSDRLPLGATMGCGVTAFTRDDAVSLLREKVFHAIPLPPLTKVIESVDVSTLDAGHVLPNMGDPTIRGVWFPRL